VQLRPHSSAARGARFASAGSSRIRWQYKVAAEPKGGVGGDASRLVYDRADAGGRNAEGESEAVDADSGGAHELFEEDFAETDGGRNG
jgi:hypothetical protein